MNHQEIVRDQSICKRKERRYRSSEDNRLRCETALADCGLRRGTVIDLSNSGLRLLCEGNFEAGQNIFTELTTIRSHGIYRGIIRRVEPWVDGQSVLGCSLEDKIPDSVLQELAAEGAVNRRSDDRIEVNQPAKLSWPLCGREVDVQLIDFSNGGMKLVSPLPVPDDAKLRFRVQVGDNEELVVQAKLAWLNEFDEGCVVGVAFTERDDPVRLAKKLGIDSESSGTGRFDPHGPRRTIGLGLATCLLVAAFSYLLSI